LSNATPPVPTDEAGIERVVRDILFPLDRELEFTTEWGCSIFVLLLAPGLFLLLWLALQMNAWIALTVTLLGLFVCWIVVDTWFDRRIAHRAARTFNQRFPEGHPSRQVAIQILSEMDCPNKAQEKLRAAILRGNRE
jgi:hypothetical protein